MSFLDIFFPKNCVSCGRSGKYICAVCLNKVPNAKLHCPVCENFNFRGKTHQSCLGKYELDGHIGIWAYMGAVRKAILRLKYNFISDLVSELVCVSAGKLEVNLDWDKFIFIAIPTSQARKNWRGFNQSEILAELFARELGGAYKSEMLLKIKNTKPQAQLDRIHRKQNIKNTFTLGPNLDVKNNRIILVDDVWTTGSTMREAGKVLKKAGASEVWGLTVAG